MKQQDFFELAEELEKKCGDWENSKGMSEEAKARLIERVEQMDREASEKTKIHDGRTAFRLKKRYVAVLAAALVLLMGMSVVGDRAWIADSTDIGRDTEVTTKVDNEEKEDILLEEEAIYQEIADKLGIVPMWLGHVPEGMVLDSYAVVEDTGWAYMNYLYNGKLVSIKMTRSSEESSSNIQWDGKSRRLSDVTNIYGHEIEAYCTDENTHNYVAGVSYGNGYYNISGIFENEKDFFEILYIIYFKNL